jgi:nondiscriminating glutamyl-tRNA synthetase
VPVVFGGMLHFDGEADEAVRAAGPEFFRTTAAAIAEVPDLGVLRAASGLKGAAFYSPLRAALTGQLHGPELAPLLKAMAPQLVRERLEQWAG